MTLITLAIVLNVTFASCTGMSDYAVRIEAIRATAELVVPVQLSLWFYTTASEKELTKVFVSGRISGTQWIELDESKSARIPVAALGEDETLSFRAALNPNRLAQPPDAVFEAKVSLPFLLTDIGGDTGTLFIKASKNAPFELRLKFTSVK